MTDREKVIKGLECHIHPFRCNDCPYWDKLQPLKDCDVEQMAKDALALLREQEPQEPFYCEADDSWGCGNCGETVGYSEFNPGGIDPVRYKHCPNCGRQVKWDET